jgi:uncharacterized protein (DUF488 family)
VVIHTVGHSTRSAEEFVELLRAHEISRLADVRTIPRSRRHPQFSREKLAPTLEGAAIAYRHYAGLGGLRKPRADSRNTAWRNEGFRGYADYMEASAFTHALEDLIAWAAESGGRPAVDARVAVMCAEALWWRCHRQLIADALVIRGIEVAHITGLGEAALHRLTAFARVEGAHVSYPGLL